MQVVPSDVTVREELHRGNTERARHRSVKRATEKDDKKQRRPSRLAGGKPHKPAEAGPGTALGCPELAIPPVKSGAARLGGYAAGGIGPATGMAGSGGRDQMSRDLAEAYRPVRFLKRP